jgi:hypothetical protein
MWAVGVQGVWFPSGLALLPPDTVEQDLPVDLLAREIGSLALPPTAVRFLPIGMEEAGVVQDSIYQLNRLMCGLCQNYRSRIRVWQWRDEGDANLVMQF